MIESLGIDVHAPAVAVVVGVVLLLFGRRVYWLLVGAAGFAAGVVFAERFAGQPPAIVLAIAVGAGLVGALLALWLQRAMVVIAGFVVGAATGASLFPAADPQALWLPVAAGGVVGAVLGFVLLDWALIVLSSLGGASLITRALVHDRTLLAPAFLGAAAVGVVVQGMQLRGRRRR